LKVDEIYSSETNISLWHRRLSSHSIHIDNCPKSPRFTKDHIHPIKTLAIWLVIQNFPSHSFFTSTNVAYAIGPSVNTLKALLIFLPNPIFAICLNFQQQNSLQNQYLLHFSFENCEVNSNRSMPRVFQQHPQILVHFSVSTLFNFHWKKGAIIKSFHTLAHWELSKDLKNVMWSAMIWEILVWQRRQNKTNYLAS
jgi:hypothetical protein